MATRRRWLQFSLRGFLVVLTIGCVWFGVIVNRARDQRGAVKAVEAMGGTVFYDWELVKLPSGTWDVVGGEPNEPIWLRRLFGDDFFHGVRGVHFFKLSPKTEPNILKSIPYLQQMRGLEVVSMWSSVQHQTQEELKAALSGSEIELFR